MAYSLDTNTVIHLIIGTATVTEQYEKCLYNKVGDADILIAAFCLENDYTLVTNNTKDFVNIKGLLINDWTK